VRAAAKGFRLAIFRARARCRFKRQIAQRRAHRPEKFQEQPKLLLFVSINRSTRNRVALKATQKATR
jgi:hypothetical protein